MAKLLTILFFISFGTMKAHVNVQFEKTYGNVYLVSSTYFYTEEVNKNIITAKYVELLLKELNYENIVKLILIQKGDFECNAYFSNEDPEDKSLTIILFEKETDIIKTLNLVENIILNHKLLKEKRSKFLEWYNSKSSKRIEDILQNKISRPKDVPEITSSDYFDYFYQNGIYHILSHQNREVLEAAQLTKILQLAFPTPNLLFIFTETEVLTIINSNYSYNFDEKKYKHTSKTFTFDFLPEWKHSFRPYSIRLLGNRFITITSLFGDQVSLYNISKNKLTQDLLSIIDGL